MSVQDQTQSIELVNNDSIVESVSDATSTPPRSSSNEVPEVSIIDWIMSSTDTNADATPPPSSTAPRISRVPVTVREKHDYEKYYVPMFVSIGPYHFGKEKLQLVEKRKPVIALKLLRNDKKALTSLYEKLGEPKMLDYLRSYYEENSTTQYTNKVFTKMMLLDSCFILYFIEFFYGLIPECHSALRSNEIFFVRRDLYLLENQIPFKVLKEVNRFLEINLLKNIKPFIDNSSFVIRRRLKTKWLDNFKKKPYDGGDEDEVEPNHLLGVLHGEHSRIVKVPIETFEPFKFRRHNFRNVTELVDVGIHFKPIKDTLSMAHIEYVKGWWWFSANVKLPPIAVSDYSRPMLLNLMAYERCNCSIDDSWVSSYVRLLDYLIDNVEDVKVLRKAWVLENLLGSDQEVVKWFDEIGADLIENSSPYPYLKAIDKMQGHYESRSNTVFGQLKKEYFKSPWTFFALLGALIALFLTGVQAYFTVWSPKSTCDDLCMFLKMNHHL